ncbi:hypothetical protein CBF90_02115 [Microbacterium sp. AISO3]|uniref:hypothetical protein n=1 Tax=Microbacterium sp. AISO3 TaxID=2002831 RepID=UPI000B4C650D|nr:hypothetical protein [Microbacterium sp. AISO3]OWP20303.1 hypothetical protein CBF90_17130 [Microbacterium sp. AISO3]OWP23544.1 hypothetical protein CBF90_02115 [Microbacterium sp. AISO3]
MERNIREFVDAQVSEKIAKGEALAHRMKTAEDAAAALEEANREVTAARREALAAGWTENELKRLGLAPARAARARKRTTKPAPAAPNNAAAGGGNEEHPYGQ